MNSIKEITGLLKAVGADEKFIRDYIEGLSALGSGYGRFEVNPEPRYDTGDHPAGFVDAECEFAARHIRNKSPERILDVGSYRGFIIGMLAGYGVTTLDVRGRKSSLENETVITCDAKSIPVPDGSFDAVVSLCALEHFGLGRYGDEFDPDGDVKSFREMIRVLRPGGILVFTTTITAMAPSISFNAHRIYDRPALHSYCAGLAPLEEKYYSLLRKSFCDFDGVTKHPRAWDVYMGCWEKKA
ncbi:MAG: class I SAM-dependent methyltransferase [Spirochaetes bacterium]|jgi:SAM-dependent methyltransferase|nr:class I SAM-dependent methyltransferase [Spirochaetota bacterium]